MKFDANVQICKLSTPQTYALRGRVLRPGLPAQASHFDCDGRSDCWHWGALVGQEVIGVSTYYPEAYERRPCHNPYRLRGMAVAPEWQGLHLGQKILQAGETELRRLHCDLLWFNARANAFSFYLSMGYQFDSELFEIEGVGPHKVMSRKL